jgi:hypothetical protein
MNHKYPTSEVDAISLVHDVEYLITAGRSNSIPDQSVYRQVQPNLASFIQSAGIKFGNLLGLKFNKHLPGYSDSETRRLGIHLRDFIMTDPQWVNYTTTVQPLIWTGGLEFQK